VGRSTGVWCVVTVINRNHLLLPIYDGIKKRNQNLKRDFKNRKSKIEITFQNQKSDLKIKIKNQF
jgi:hypothetical protein